MIERSIADALIDRDVAQLGPLITTIGMPTVPFRLVPARLKIVGWQPASR